MRTFLLKTTTDVDEHQSASVYVMHLPRFVARWLSFGAELLRGGLGMLGSTEGHREWVRIEEEVDEE